MGDIAKKLAIAALAALLIGALVNLVRAEPRAAATAGQAQTLAR